MRRMAHDPIYDMNKQVLKKDAHATSTLDPFLTPTKGEKTNGWYYHKPSQDVGCLLVYAMLVAANCFHLSGAYYTHMYDFKPHVHKYLHMRIKYVFLSCSPHAYIHAYHFGLFCLDSNKQTSCVCIT